MPLRSAADYRESLRDGRAVYAHGERVDDVTTHPVTAPAVDHTAGLWDLQRDEPSRFTDDAGDGDRHAAAFGIPHDAEDLLERHERIEATAERHAGVYNMLQTLGTDVLFALLSVTPAVDAAHGTAYEERVRAFYERCRDGNLSMACAVTDPKGNRSKPPHAQSDPDLYLQVVEERSDGIILRGAKLHNPAPIADEILIIPSTALGPEDEQYAVAAAVEPAADGVRMICRPQPDGDADPRDAPVSSRHNEVQSLTVFEDVFVPVERVFLCGETDHSRDLVRRFATFCRFSALGHKAAMGEHFIGAGSLAAEYNGVDGATHVETKLTEIAGYVLRIRAFARAAAVEHGMAAEIAIPDRAYCDYGKYDFATGHHRMERHVQDLAGGAVATAPAAADLDNPVTGEDVEKYFGAIAGGENRLALLHYIRDLTASDFAGWHELSALHGGGSPEALRTSVLRNWDLEHCEGLVASVIDG